MMVTNTKNFFLSEQIMILKGTIIYQNIFFINSLSPSDLILIEPC